jgi:hypothetical protein
MSNKPKLPYLRQPCSGCPFRKTTLKGWLGEERIEEILRADTFVCHKTTKGQTRDRRQCAGHMLLKGKKNSFVLLTELMDIDLKLSGRDLVFATEKECIKHHSR